MEYVTGDHILQGRDRKALRQGSETSGMSRRYLMGKIGGEVVLRQRELQL